ncbi:S8 family serine peptidase [Aureisphaera galaxeae]|uniref:S8 family serine peptidase n=1 Tax=Aureisphaera galaxeae TaxID=1538023 RepID=UPI00234FDE17|nr:S8 family serine peptidase [Aureisphaera galaxeae]MDC8002461.1 S8 family serine peptidase [Aureisphaera galaxeae]
MKKLCLFVALLLLISACEKETTNTPEVLENGPTTDFVGGNVLVPGQVIIKYDAGLTEAEKQVLRDFYQVEDYKTCSCADPSLELWIFEVDSNGNLPGGGTLEGVTESTKDDAGVEGSEFNPIIKHDGIELSAPFGPAHITTGLDIMSTTNSGVTIAVLDTGIDYNYFRFEEPFLYNSEASGDSCTDNGMNDYIGWDFVEQDNNPFDDHGHATQVISLIYETLDAQDVDFQVLPVKVFDQNGIGTYFDILCGFRYAANNEDVAIINLSFGWYETQYELLKRFIEETLDKKVIVASAGNDENNNDLVRHYPSSYEDANILSIASWNTDLIEVGLSRFSNWGEGSVDLAAPGENIPFYIDANEYILLYGTSYANAYASAIAAGMHVPGMSPSQLISSVIASGIPDDNLNNILYHSYIYY